MPVGVSSAKDCVKATLRDLGKQAVTCGTFSSYATLFAGELITKNLPDKYTFPVMNGMATDQAKIMYKKN